MTIIWIDTWQMFSDIALARVVVVLMAAHLAGTLARAPRRPNARHRVSDVRPRWSA